MKPIHQFIFIDYSYFPLDGSLRFITQRLDCFAKLAVMCFNKYPLFYQTKVVRKICQNVTFVGVYEYLVSTLFIFYWTKLSLFTAS